MKVAGIVLTLLLVGWSIPRFLIRDGVDRFAGDPVTHAVAEGALSGAWQLQDSPFARLVTPAARVVEVWRDPGHCPGSEPGGREAHAGYRASVRLYTFFGLPAGTIHVTCGGWHWSRFPPAA